MSDIHVPRALTIAGSDSGGGAGIQADLKTFQMLGVFGTSAITAITAQNTLGVQAIADVSPEMVAAQIQSVASDIGVDAAKTGMLSRAETIDAVAEQVRRLQISRLVIDPVMVAKGGAKLLADAAENALRTELLPLAYVITPNIPEAERLLGGMSIRSVRDMQEAAKRLQALGPANVIVKGGHLEDAQEAADVVWDGSVMHVLRSPRYPTRHTHGTGCTFSAAITAYLARGEELMAAVEKAKQFISDAIRYPLEIGEGHGPTNHWAPLLVACPSVQDILSLENTVKSAQ